MFDLKRKLLVLVMGCLLPVGVFAQGQGDKRPPKDDKNRVLVEPKQKEQKPPPSNNNQGNNRDGKKGKP